MKSLLIFLTSFSIMLTACNGQGNKANRPSPPMTAKETLASGATVTINYSQPSLKGRTVGKDVEPMEGKIWRAGANEATTFEIDRDVKINGSVLPKGKYGLFTLSNGDDWTVIFNKVWEQWGAFSYREADDALRVNVKATKPAATVEKLSYTINKDGTVTLAWGDRQVSFKVE